MMEEENDGRNTFVVSLCLHLVYLFLLLCLENGQRRVQSLMKSKIFVAPHQCTVRRSILISLKCNNLS